MTTNTPAPAHEAVLTAEQEIDAIMEQAQVFASAWAFLGGPFDNGSGLETAERERASLRALLSKLRATVADERAAFEDWLLTSNVKAHIGYSTDELTLARVAWDERARRAAQASAPVAGEAQPSDIDILGLAGLYLEPARPATAAQVVNFSRALLRNYAAPQASEAVRDAARYRWLRDPSNEVNVEIPRPAGDGYDLPGYGDKLDAAIDAALSAQPGAQKENSNEA